MSEVMETINPEDEELDVLDIVKALRQRANTYGLLSRLYREEVDEDFLEKLHGMRFPASTGNAEVDKGFRMIATYLSGRWSSTVTELAVDFCRVFMGTNADAFSAAFPLESVYTSEKRLRMQEARDEVLAIYRSEGLDKSETWKESEDHLAAELEFMQTMCNRSAEALLEGDEDAAIALLRTQANFLDDHLLSWVPMMSADMKRFTRTDFYRGLSFLTDGFLDTDKDFLTDLLASVKEEENKEEEE